MTGIGGAMQVKKQIPNMLSCYRLAVVPVLICLAYYGKEKAFLLVFISSLLTDSVDGWLARKLGVTSDLGARLDSVGDVVTFGSLPILAIWLWPDIVDQERFFILSVAFALLFSELLGVLRFHRLPAYHTYLAKVSAVVMGGSVLLLFGRITPWPFRIFFVVPVLCALEELAITLVLPSWHSNVPSIWHALRYRREERPPAEC